MKFINVFFFLSVLGLCSCASLSNSLDANRAKSIRKVAIVSFEIEQDRATDNLGLSGFKSLSEGEDKDSKELQTMAMNIANNFSTQIQKKTLWQVLSINDVISNNEYKKKVQLKMSGARMVLMTGGNHSFAIYPKGLLDAMAFRNMSVDDRKTLAKELGVDALAEVVVINTMEQSQFSLGHLTGDADFAFTSRANLQVYGLDSGDPIWRSQNVSGETTEKSDKLSDKLTKREKISFLGEKASKSAIEKLVETYSL